MNQNNLQPDQKPALLHAIALHRSGKLAEAAAQYKRLLNETPKDPNMLSGLGSVALQMGNHEIAIKLLAESLAINQHQLAACLNLGVAFHQTNRPGKALACYDRAIAISPGHAAAHFRRGVLLEELKRFDDALASYDQVVKIKPGHVLAYVYRGTILEKLNRSAESLASFEQAIALKPDQPLLYVNCGVLLQNECRFDEALNNYDKAISLQPDYAEAYWFKALLKLLAGDYLQGWQLHEWRWRSRGYSNLVRDFKQPLWLGEQSIRGKTLLIHAEVGLGDSIQFSRYVPMLEAMGAKVILEMPEALVPVVSTLKSECIVVKKGDPLPEFDYHCPAMSLPLVFKTTLENIPASVPYFYADPAKQKIWQKRLGKQKKPRVGLVWSGLLRGNIDFNPAKKRSIPLELLEPMLNMSLEFHVLQKDIKMEDAKFLTRFKHVHTHQDELVDFSDTAALIQEMDLVITIDTSVAHLAGALGKPLWVMLPYITDYRWTLEGNATPWYPTATLFRQKVAGDWAAVMTEVTRKLETMVSKEAEPKPKPKTKAVSKKPKAETQSSFDL